MLGLHKLKERVLFWRQCKYICNYGRFGLISISVHMNIVCSLVQSLRIKC